RWERNMEKRGRPFGRPLSNRLALASEGLLGGRSFRGRFDSGVAGGVGGFTSSGGGVSSGVLGGRRGVGGRVGGGVGFHGGFFSGGGFGGRLAGGDGQGGDAGGGDEQLADGHIGYPSEGWCGVMIPASPDNAIVRWPVK